MLSELKKRKSAFLALPLLASAALSPSRAQALSMTCAQPLEFGSIMSCASSGSVTVKPDGSTTSSGCVTPLGALYSPGICLISQSHPPSAIQVSVGASTYTISSGGNTMPINNFNVKTNAGGRTYTISATVFASVPIGGQLNIGANQPRGTYTGSMVVNINLQ